MINRIKKIFHIHSWQYFNYVPHGCDMYPKERWSWAEGRKCIKCNKYESGWFKL